MTKPGAYRSPLTIECQSCSLAQPGTEFRGNRMKTAACRTCEANHLGRHWCVDCSDWIDDKDFYRVGKDQAFMTNKCKPCWTISRHGVTAEFMRQLTGSDLPRCGACGDAGLRLSIDHDHDHCPGELGCASCVRGYLCQPCNTAEGYLKTADRAIALARYMARTKLSVEQLAELPPTTRTGRKRDRRVPGANRKYYDHSVSPQGRNAGTPPVPAPPA